MSIVQDWANPITQNQETGATLDEGLREKKKNGLYKLNDWSEYYENLVKNIFATFNTIRYGYRHM